MSEPRRSSIKSSALAPVLEHQNSGAGASRRDTLRGDTLKGDSKKTADAVSLRKRRSLQTRNTTSIITPYRRKGYPDFSREPLGGYLHVPKEVFGYGLDPYPLRYFLFCLNRANKSGLVWGDTRTTGALVHMDQSTVVRARQLLRKAKLLRRVGDGVDEVPLTERMRLRKQKDFLQLPRYVLYDPNLNPNDLRILIEYALHPDWLRTYSEISEFVFGTHEGFDRVRRSVSHLINLGYLDPVEEVQPGRSRWLIANLASAEELGADPVALVTTIVDGYRETRYRVLKPEATVEADKAQGDTVKAFWDFFVMEGEKVRAPRPRFGAEERRAIAGLLTKHKEADLREYVRSFWLRYSQPFFEEPSMHITRLFQACLPKIKQEL